jgi:hypothetical protein
MNKRVGCALGAGGCGCLGLLGVVLLIIIVPGLVLAPVAGLFSGTSANAQLAVAPPTPMLPTPSDRSIMGGAEASAAQLNTILANFGSPMVGLGQVIADWAQQTGVDDLFAMGIFREEANFAQPGSLAYINRNPGNIEYIPGCAHDNGRFANCATFADGIQGFFQLAQSYANGTCSVCNGKSLGDVVQFVYTYAPPIENDSAGYAANVLRWWAEWEGNQGPSGWPLNGAITQGFGCTMFSAEPPEGSCPHFHRGLDISDGHCGSPLVATMGGTIHYLYQPNGYGDYVTITNPSSPYVVIMGHTSGHPSTLTDGDQVTPGEVIAYEGETGNATGCHVHYELDQGYLGGTPVDPSGTL